MILTVMKMTLVIYLTSLSATALSSDDKYKFMFIAFWLHDIISAKDRHIQM